MRVAKDGEICGLPTPLARALMRKLSQTPQRLSVTAQALDMDESGASAKLFDLSDAGYVRRVDDGIQQGDWVTTIRGNALAHASFGRPINRTTAERHLSGFLERTRAWNADDSRLLSIEQVTVFGSYLNSDVEMLGDLDLAITMRRREADPHRWSELVNAYAHASGRRFSNIVEELLWPRTELIMYLKNRSPAISITNEDVSQITARYRQLYAVTDDLAAVRLASTAPVQT